MSRNTFITDYVTARVDCILIYQHSMIGKNMPSPTFLQNCKKKKHTYTDNSLQFNTEINTSGNKTLTTLAMTPGFSDVL